MHSDTARFGIKVFKDCIILFCLSVLKKKRWNQRSLNILKPRFNLWKQLQLRIHFIHVCRDHLSIPWIFKSYENTYNLPFSFWKVWIYGFKVPIFFFWQIFSTYSNKVVVTEKFIEEKKPYPWNNKLYPFIRQCVSVGESGLLLAVKPPNTDTFYLGPKTMNEKKIMKNVLQLGDEFFNFGDLVYLDHDYYVYFRDRIGDTFR